MTGIQFLECKPNDLPEYFIVVTHRKIDLIEILVV